MEMEGELQRGALRLQDKLFHNEDEVSLTEDSEGEQDDVRDVLRYYTNICAIGEIWEYEREPSCAVAVSECDEYEGGGEERWVNLMALSNQAEDESAVGDGEREYAADDAGEWEVGDESADGNGEGEYATDDAAEWEGEWGLLVMVEVAAAAAATATVTTTTSTTTIMEVEQGLEEERQGMGGIGGTGGMVNNNNDNNINDNNNNSNFNNGGERRMGKLGGIGGIIHINAMQLKQSLLPSPLQCLTNISSLLPKLAAERYQSVLERKDEFEHRYDDVVAHYGLMEEYNIKVPPLEYAAYQTLTPDFNALKSTIEVAEASKDDNIKMFAADLERSVEYLNKEVIEIRQRAQNEIIFDEGRFANCLEFY
ncbi:hypothetical protein CBR_g67 [Chara braunii]|uniref:Uncharacterized protein n=1 Tax=Chara braunii TaxID=69332 RepID=A0A388JLG6_CHABU|nr:hypothetical protein CBR_g67 [Chara braunii]|eukprot:GBG58666.1 hypothetical protein CBR_g67 [Chara braunii]